MIDRRTSPSRFKARATATKHCALLLFSLLLASIFIARSANAGIEEPGINPDGAAKLLRLTDKGINHPQLNMTTDDSVLFFLNSTKDSLITLEIDYGGRHTHCASAQLTVEPDQKIKTKVPISPNDFASVCFHDPGDYPYIIYGLPISPEGVRGTVHVTK